MSQILDFNELQASIQVALVASTKTVGRISSEDLGFQRSLNPEICSALDKQSARLLELSNKILKSSASIRELKAPRLEDVDDVENRWNGVVDIVDSLLEKTDTSLDEYSGVVRNVAPGSQKQSNAAAAKGNRQVLPNAFRSHDIPKPQLKFAVKTNNFEGGLWKPLLTSKPHATKPLESSTGIVTNKYGRQEHKHPYQQEIENYEFPPSLYQSAEPTPYTNIDTTTATFVDTFEGVLEMLRELKKAKEIAIDLEHHDQKSYIGLLSLMQISTRDRDWIVDTLQPWRQELEVLNEVFADPNILKVLHGALSDIVWLQRDLGLYVVGLFDTHEAAVTLSFPKKSLAYLLKRFVDFDADKKYQMADWRIRPLPEEMFFYARCDTHYLLYIFDHMRNLLIEQSNEEAGYNCMDIVLEKSKEVALKTFERPVYDTQDGKGYLGWYNLYASHPMPMNPEAFSVFRAVHAWRDSTARVEDVNPQSILSTNSLFQIAKAMPTSLVALRAMIRPSSLASRPHFDKLPEIISEARKAASAPGAPTVMETLKAASTKLAVDLPQKIKSLFWGDAFGSSIWDKSKSTSPSNAKIKLAIPLPPLASASFSENGHLAPNSRQPEPIAEPITEYTTPVVDSPFTIKTGIKRKSEALSTEGEDAEDDVKDDGSEISLTDAKGPSPEELARRLAAREDKLKRKEKKAAKRAAKAAKAQAQAQPTQPSSSNLGADQEVEEEPFDYSKAESVLHSKQAGAREKGKKKKSGEKATFDKPFDPYKKSEDAAKGMRRVQSEKTGKSFTFKN